MQSGRSDRLIRRLARYRFDSPVDEALLRERLQALTAPYRMFRRNVVEVNGLPYWQSVNIDWNVNFRVLEPEEDADAVRDAAEVAVSQASAPGDGVPLFRAIAFCRWARADLRLAPRSDLEGMFNAHARHLFAREDERTRFGYQITEASARPRVRARPRRWRALSQSGRSASPATASTSDATCYRSPTWRCTHSAPRPDCP